MKNTVFTQTKRGFVIILIASFLFCLYPTSIYATGSFAVNAKAAVLYEPDMKTFLYTKNCDARLPMASTTKIMTALVAIERENINKKIAVDTRAVGVEGSSAYLRAGEEFTLKELLYALMLRSANDAAEAIAYALAGSIGEFAALMNEKAAQLGLIDTHFANPHGLDHDEHYTTAKELAIITAAALEYPEFCEIVSTRTKRIEKDGLTRIFTNHNRLLSAYSGCIGVKTGYTKRTGRCLVSAAERDGVKLIAVTLACPDDWHEHEQMLDLGFSLLERVTIFGKADFAPTLDVADGMANSITLGIERNITVIKKKSDDAPKIVIDIPKSVAAPISRGDAVGRIQLIYPDGTIEFFDVIAVENVKKAKKKGLFGLFE